MHCLKQYSFCSSRESRSEFSRAGEPEENLILLRPWLYKFSYNCKKVYVTFDFLKSDTIFQTAQ